MLRKFTLRIIGRSQKHSFRSIMGFSLVIAMMVSTSGVISGFSVQIFGMTEKVGESDCILIQTKSPDDGISHEIFELINHTNIKQVLPIAERRVQFYSEFNSFNSYIVGVNFSEFINYYSKAEVYPGRLPQSNVSIPECIIGSDLQELISSPELNLSDNLKFIIIGLIQNVKEFQSTILIELTDYFRLFSQNASVNLYQRIKIRLRNGRFIDETISDLSFILKDQPQSLVIKPEQQAGVFSSSLYSDIIAHLNFLFGVLFVIVLIRIFHTISWYVRNYERDLLIMRSLGMSAYQIFSLVIFLALLIGNIGFIIGFFFGLLIPSLMFTILTLFFNSVFLVPDFAVYIIIPLFVLSNLVVMAAALYPAIIISKKRPSTLSLPTHTLDR